MSKTTNIVSQQNITLVSILKLFVILELAKNSLLERSQVQENKQLNINRFYDAESGNNLLCCHSNVKIFIYLM